MVSGMACRMDNWLWAVSSKGFENAPDNAKTSRGALTRLVVHGPQHFLTLGSIPLQSQVIYTNLVMWSGKVTSDTLNSKRKLLL